MTETQLSARSKSKLWQLFDEYAKEVDESRLAESSKVDYINFAWMFVRWIDGEFTPGSNIK